MKRGWNLYVKFPSHTLEHERVKIHPINIILNDLELLHLLPSFAFLWHSKSQPEG